MKRLLPVVLSVVTCVCVMAACERQAMAYVDPGSGLLALQSIASMFAATAFFLRKRILGIFTREKERPASSGPEAVRKEDSRNAA